MDLVHVPVLFYLSSLMGDTCLVLVLFLVGGWFQLQPWFMHWAGFFSVPWVSNCSSLFTGSSWTMTCGVICNVLRIPPWRVQFIWSLSGRDVVNHNTPNAECWRVCMEEYKYVSIIERWSCFDWWSAADGSVAKRTSPWKLRCKVLLKSPASYPNKPDFISTGKQRKIIPSHEQFYSHWFFFLAQPTINIMIGFNLSTVYLTSWAIWALHSMLAPLVVFAFHPFQITPCTNFDVNPNSSELPVVCDDRQVCESCDSEIVGYDCVDTKHAFSLSQNCTTAFKIIQDAPQPTYLCKSLDNSFTCKNKKGDYANCQNCVDPS